MSSDRPALRRFRRRAREGMQRPPIFEADDGYDYVLKLDIDERGFPSAELVCAELTGHLGVRSPSHAVLSCPDALIGVMRAMGDPDQEAFAESFERCGGTCFGSRYLSGSPTKWSEDLRSAVQDADAALARLLVFDGFIRNMDRSAAHNPNILIDRGRLYAIDHGQALPEAHGAADTIGFPYDSHLGEVDGAAPMTPYHYSIVRCRDGTIAGEDRNVGLLVMCPTEGKAWLRRGDLKRRAHLVDDEAAFVRALLDALETRAKAIARDGDPKLAHAWLSSHARPSEDALTLAAPAVGIAADIRQEVRRLRELYLGKQGGGGRTVAEKIQRKVLAEAGLGQVFQPRALTAGPVEWKFSAVAEEADRLVLFPTLDFSQTTPKGLLEAAFKNVGRVGEVRHYLGHVDVVTITSGPEGGDRGRAYRRATEIMDDAGMGVLHDEAGALAALEKLGLRSDDARAAEA